MGQVGLKSAFRSTESSSKIKELKSIDDIIDNCKELQLALMKLQVMKELDCKIDISILNNLKSPVTWLMYKFPGYLKFRFRFMKFGGYYEQRNLNINQFYEFYEKFQNFLTILESEKIDLKTSRELIFSKKTDTKVQLEETKLGESKQKDDPSRCVLCFENAIGMLLPCYHGFCETCSVDWYKTRGKTQCPICRASLTQSAFDNKIFLVASREQAVEINQSIKEEFVRYLNTVCREIKFP